MLVADNLLLHDRFNSFARHRTLNAWHNNVRLFSFVRTKAKKTNFLKRVRSGPRLYAINALDLLLLYQMYILLLSSTHF